MTCIPSGVRNWSVLYLTSAQVDILLAHFEVACDVLSDQTTPLHLRNPSCLAFLSMHYCCRLGDPESLPKAAALAVRGMREGGRRRVLVPPQGGWTTDSTQVRRRWSRPPQHDFFSVYFLVRH